MSKKVTDTVLKDTKFWSALKDGTGWEGKSTFKGAIISGAKKLDGSVQYFRLVAPSGEQIKYLKNYNESHVLDTAERLLMQGRYV